MSEDQIAWAVFSACCLTFGVTLYFVAKAIQILLDL